MRDDDRVGASPIPSVSPSSPTVVEDELQGAGAMSKQDLFHLLMEQMNKQSEQMNRNNEQSDKKNE